MTVEIFTQLTAKGDQLQQQYELRKRFCIDHLGWPDRNVWAGMEYDQYDHPFAVYFVWRDEENVARAMFRATQCNLPFMIKDVWPHLVSERDMPDRMDQWELTRVCVERCIGKQIGRAIGEIMLALEIFAEKADITEYWWLSPKHRIETLIPHNHYYAGDGEQIGDEFCFAGWCNPKEMLIPKHREQLRNAGIPLEFAA